MGKKLEPDNKSGRFYYKSLLIFSGVFAAVSFVCVTLLGKELGIAQTVAYHTYGIIIVTVPFVVHLYTWGLFLDYKNVSILPIIIKVCALLYIVVVPVLSILGIL